MALAPIQGIRPANSALLFKLQSADGVEAAPGAGVDAIGFELDSVEYPSPYTTDTSNEATGSLVAGAPLVLGQPATFSFRTRIRGAGAGTAYTSSVKPPLHQLLQACGKRGQFHAAIAAAAATAGSATTATLASAFPGVARALVGLMLEVTGGAGAGYKPFVTDYDAARLATLSDSFAPPLDASSTIGLPATWSYAGTSPKDATARLSDHPAGTLWFYEDGNLLRFMDCRGTVTLDGETAKPGFAKFDMTGIYLGTTPVALPAGLVVPNAQPPQLLQGTGLAPAFLYGRRGLQIESWSFADGGQVESPADPNTFAGFAGGTIGQRTPQLTIEPIRELVSVRDTLADVAAGNRASIAMRHGSLAGNRWGLVMPLAQPVSANPGRRGQFRTEQTVMQAIPGAQDPYGRDTESVMIFN